MQVPKPMRNYLGVIQEMNKEEISFMLEAGFSISEIMSMQTKDAAPTYPVLPANPAPAPSVVLEDEPDIEIKPLSEDEKKAYTQAAAETVAKNYNDMANIENQMNEVITMLRANNLSKEFGSPQPERTTEDILAEIINPPKRK